MTKILFTYELLTATVETTMDQFQMVCHGNDISAVWLPNSLIKRDEIDRADIVIAIRPSTPASVYVAKRAKRSGRLYAAFFDDDLLELYRNIVPDRIRVKSINICLSSADLLITVNQLLSEKYKCLCRNAVQYIFTSPVRVEKGPVKTDGNSIKILYATSNDHLPAFDKLIRPVIKLIGEQVGRRVEFCFIGIHPDIPDNIKNVTCHYYPHMRYAAYCQFMESQRFDIGIAPLSYSEFSSMKYYNKFLEYSKYGICGIYSELLPYTLIVKNGENGILVKEAPEKWQAAIVDAINNSVLRKSCIENAQKLILDKFDSVCISKEFNMTISMLEYSSECRKVNYNTWHAKLLEKVFSVYNLVKKVHINYRTDGIRGTIAKAKMHIAIRKKYKEVV